MKDINKQVDQVLGQQRQRKHRRKLRSKKLLGIPIGTLAMAFVVTASLLFLGTYYLVITETIDLNGVEDFAVYYDDVGIVQENTPITGTDIPLGTMDPGDWINASHNITVTDYFDTLPRNVMWDIDELIATVGDFINDPTNEYYGFYFKVCEDDSGSPGTTIDFNTNYTIDNNATTDFWYCYALDSAYIDGVTPLPFQMNVTIAYEYGILTAGDDSFTFDNGDEPGSGPGINLVAHGILLNDTQSLGLDFDIVSFDDTGTWGTVTLSNGILYWAPANWVGTPMVTSLTYTISDGHNSDTATVDIDYLG